MGGAERNTDRQDPNGRRRFGEQSGFARFTVDDDSWAMSMRDNSLSALQDMPSIPLPRLTVTGLQPTAPPPRKFGSSLTSLVSSFGRSSGGSTTIAPSVDSRYDDTDSFRGLSISSSSTHSREIRKQKSSTFLAKLRSQSSKQHLRSESSDSEHPSLRPPMPIPPQQYNNSIFNMSTPTIVSIPATMSKAKKSLGSKKSGQNSKQLPQPSPKADPLADFNNLMSPSGIVDIPLDEVGSFIDLSRGSAGGAVGSGLAYKTSLARDAEVLPQFSNPFPSGPNFLDRHHHHHWQVTRKTSNPLPPDSAGLSSGRTDALPASPISSWPVPPSWSVVGKHADARPEDEPSDASDTDEGGTTDDQLFHGQSARKASSTPATSISPAGETGRAILKDSLAQMKYGIILFLPSGRQHLVQVGLETTVAGLTAGVIRDIELERKKDQPSEQLGGCIQLYLKEQMRERALGPNEKPAAIVKLRMEQAGYTVEDGMQLIGPENLHILLRFVYKAEVLAGEGNIDFENYEVVDLTAYSLRTIPPIVHQNAEHIATLKLSRNPMLEIPLDFIQSCLMLSSLHLTHMYMKQVPESVQYCLSLHSLDISSNAIRDLGNTDLTGISKLLTIEAQNNRLSTVPSHFGRLKTLTHINISNNKFRIFPIVLSEISTLRYLDISFNMITELPAEIGFMISLKTFIIIGNQVSRFPEQMSNLVYLRTLDVRRNNIYDLSIPCHLPRIQHLSADHNVVRALDLALGPRMSTLIVSHNDITQLSLAPGPMGSPPYALRTLDLSYAKLSSIDDLALGQLSALRVLRLDHNSIRTIPESLGSLNWLEVLSCTDNELDSLPSTIGKLQKLEMLDAHNNNINELPHSLWNCASLTKINLTSNFIEMWPELSVSTVQTPVSDGSSPVSVRSIALPSSSSSRVSQSLPSLAFSLEKLYIGGNLLTDHAIVPFMIFKELRVLNMSFNDIHDLPPNYFRNMGHLEELYLSGNKLISIPVEDLPRLKRLSTLFLNGNKLQTLPQELGQVSSLRILDVGSNYLKYNINNWEFDWNWNFNTNLKYLNLSGNNRFQIKASMPASVRTSKVPVHQPTPMMSGFKSLSQLRVLGLMDVTITTTAHDAVDIPDENADRRVRTSLSTVCNMGYGISDSLGKNDHLTMLDLVHEVQGSQDEAIFAIFGRTHPPRGLRKGSSPNRLTKYLHDNFVKVFKEQLERINSMQTKRHAVPAHVRKEGIHKALTCTFLKLNQDFCEVALTPLVKNSQPNNNANPTETPYFRTGVAAVVVYLLERTLYAANVGDALAVVSRQGVCHEISRKHHPFDRIETARIRAAEGYISPMGQVNDEVKISRAFGYYHLFPPINARPDVFTYDLSEMDQFVIIANRGLWDYVPYQTAVDIVGNVARTQRPDAMLAAQKLRDFAISYGADGSTMIMVVWVADLYKTQTATPVIDYRRTKPNDVHGRGIKYLPYEIPAPVGHITLVFTDIRNSTHLWEVNPGMPTAMRLHNTLLRRQLRFCGGYEVKTEGDSFMCSFPNALAALWWCLTVQVQLLHESWPLEILECEDGQPMYDAQGQLIARGLSVRMGIHSGTPLCEPDLITHRMDYFGPMVNRSARIESSAQGGQIACSQDAVNEINMYIPAEGATTSTPATATSSTTAQPDVGDLSDAEAKANQVAAIEAIQKLGLKVVRVGEVKLKGIELPEILYVLYPSGLQARHELKEPSADPAASSSLARVHWPSPAQLAELGIVCLRIEALSTGRRFKAISERKESIGTIGGATSPTAPNGPETGEGELEDDPKFLYCDPKLLLPPVTDRTSDEQLMRVLDSLIGRILNAINTLGQDLAFPKPPPRSSRQQLMSTLQLDGKLDEETIKYISGLLERW